MGVALNQAGQQRQARQLQRASAGRGHYLRSRTSRSDFVACNQNYPAGMTRFSIKNSRGAQQGHCRGRYHSLPYYCD
jgi:hypothetical protein